MLTQTNHQCFLWFPTCSRHMLCSFKFQGGGKCSCANAVSMVWYCTCSNIPSWEHCSHLQYAPSIIGKASKASRWTCTCTCIHVHVPYSSHPAHAAHASQLGSCNIYVHIHVHCAMYIHTCTCVCVYVVISYTCYHICTCTCTCTCSILIPYWVCTFHCPLHLGCGLRMAYMM